MQATESGHLAEKVLQAGKKVSYWKSNKVKYIFLLLFFFGGGEGGGQ
jgi:hypothetical protein